MTITFKARHSNGFWVDSPIQPFTFPAGEAHVKVNDNADLTEYSLFLADIRGQDPQDLLHLAMWEDVLIHEAPHARRILFLPYLPAARADRGRPLGAEVYARWVNGLNIDQIITIDPHSPVAPEQYFREPTIFPVERIIRKVLQDSSRDSKPNNAYVGVIAPDKGAVDRATRAATVMGVPVFRAEKSRDFESGKLTGFQMLDELPAEGKLLIVDDICDGGGTFIGIAEATGLPKERLDLWVTHGVFSKGLRALSEHFGQVHTTDSYANRTALFSQHINDHDVYELTLAADEGGDFLFIHEVAPYFYPEIVSEEDVVRD